MPVAFDEVVVSIQVVSAADEAVLDELAEGSRRLSPMFQSFANPIPMHLDVERAS